jgi:hypothetical protein
MVDILRLIEDAYELYKERWRGVITAFVVIFLIALVFGILNFIISLPGQFLCNGKESVIIALLFCISPQIIQNVLNFISSLIDIMVTMAVMKPMDEMAGGKTISGWTGHFSKQVVNSILVILLRVIVSLICFAPMIIIIILNISVLVAWGNSTNFGTLLTGGLLIFFLVLLVCMAIFTIANFLLTFLEVEVVLGRNGVLQAGVKSAKLVANNLVDVLVYSIIWFLISIGLGVVVLLLMCTVCLLPVAYLIGPLIVVPIELLSKIMLWRKLTESA